MVLDGCGDRFRSQMWGAEMDTLSVRPTEKGWVGRVRLVAKPETTGTGPVGRAAQGKGTLVVAKPETTGTGPAGRVAQGKGTLVVAKPKPTGTGPVGRF
jgi:hypothetical protein